MDRMGMNVITGIAALTAAVLLIVAFQPFGPAAVGTRGPVASRPDSGRAFWLPSGRETYRIAQASEVLPRIIEATIDPPDVHVGDVQGFEVVAYSPAGIESVTAVIERDHGTSTVALAKTGERAADAEVWTGEWTVFDTHDTTYHTTFIAKDNEGRTNSITIAWSDACGISFDGPWDIVTSHGTNCTISSTDGVEDGNVTIRTYTLTLNATFAFNSGYSITVTSSGAIAIGSGGSIVQTELWGYDGDGDGWASSTQAAQDSDPGAGWEARGTFSGSVDCYDANELAFPSGLGSFPYYGAHRGDGSWDYNCNDTQERFNPVLFVETTCNQNPPTCSIQSSGTTGWVSSVPGTCGATGDYQAAAIGCIQSGASCVPEAGASQPGTTMSCR